jgi:hypothetical protein
MSETVSLEVAIEVVLRNGPNFETIAGLCKMAVEAEREACAKVCDDYETGDDITTIWLNTVADAIRARGQA